VLSVGWQQHCSRTASRDTRPCVPGCARMQRCRDSLYRATGCTIHVSAAAVQQDKVACLSDFLLTVFCSGLGACILRCSLHACAPVLPFPPFSIV
jgi:hypothetical protein